MKLKNLKPEERPREKMLMRGAEALSDGELLAVLLGSGTREKNALEVARDLLGESQWKLSTLAGRSPAEIMKIEGMGRTKAIIVLAALELGRRAFLEENIAERPPITTPKDVYRIAGPLLGHLDHEECWIIHLSKSNAPICEEKITVGGFDSTIIDVRQIASKVLEKKAAGIILVHNHPGGTTKPSRADIQETTRLKNSLDMLGVELVDHVIISGRRFYSFTDDKEYRASL
ncbi:MAG: DNA repair protein RadC [Bacteroidales bacterium]|nr:DNA repair protein RadC [Bacteroidales bacterium]